MRPIAKIWIKYTIFLIILVIFLKIFRVFFEIDSRGNEEENFLKMLMSDKLDHVKREYQIVLSFLKEAYDIFSLQIEN